MIEFKKWLMSMEGVNILNAIEEVNEIVEIPEGLILNLFLMFQKYLGIVLILS